MKGGATTVAQGFSPAWAVAFIALGCAACSDPEREKLKATTKATYDERTGRLKELTSDANGNGRIDTWTDMDGSRPLRSRMDRNEDGRLDRWEYYDDNGKLMKVGFSRRDSGKPDAWAVPSPDGRILRVLASSTGDESKIDRWETYDPAAPPTSSGQAASTSSGQAEAQTLAAVEEDTNHDGKPDKWEKYSAGVLQTAAFDENGDGRVDRQLTFRDGALILIESEPDASGSFKRRVEVR